MTYEVRRTVVLGLPGVPRTRRAALIGQALADIVTELALGQWSPMADELVEVELIIRSRVGHPERVAPILDSTATLMPRVTP